MSTMAEHGTATWCPADDDRSALLTSYDGPTEEDEYAGPPRAAVYLWTARTGKRARRLLRAQEEELRAYCDCKGYEVTEVISDQGPGPLLERVGIRSLLDSQQVWQVFDLVVVRAPDRLPGDPDRVQAFLDTIQRAGAPAEFVHRRPRHTVPQPPRAATSGEEHPATS